MLLSSVIDIKLVVLLRTVETAALLLLYEAVYKTVCACLYLSVGVST